MNFFNKTLILLSTLLLLSWGAHSQQFKENGSLWSDIGEKLIPQSGKRYITPTKYRTVKLNVATMRDILYAAPMEFTPVAQMTKTYLELPMPDGSMQTFDIVESPIMAPELAEKFPEISTYAGYGVDNPSWYVRFDLTPQGFHAMILIPGESTVFIDPYSFGGGDITHYISYFRTDFVSSVPKIMECGVTEYYDHGRNNPLPDLKAAYGTCELRTYRLAVAATGEYTQFHGGTVALALAAQNTTMNRVNGLYEKDMAIRMNIIANNNLIIYTNAATDPYTNNDGATMLNQNQTNLTNVIGGANYDIGHVFSTGGGGIAQLASVCVSTGKARGVTGSPSPVGDPFDIDYVAHEMGHQFAANHTQNNGCNRNNATAMEPGSASTIMGYAGICAPNVQNNSDDYFHNISLQEIGAFITSTGHTCPVKTALSNSAPTVTVAATTVNVPRSTPFFLTANATDPNTSNVLTYCWEQMNNQTSTQPPVSTATGGPNFRTFDPTTNPTRYFPNLTALAANGPFTWEVLPSVTRTMNFRVAVRDNAPGGSCSASANVAVAVDGNSGPFEVTYPSATGIIWGGNTTQTVTWNVAGTTNTPVSCANVDILLSIDGGQNYTLVLANTPNDGTQSITVPNTPSTTCRIMVKCSNGYFFDISNNNFTITAATNDYTLTVNNTSVAVCQPNNAIYNISIGVIGTYNSPVTLSLSGLPAGASSNFSINPVTPAGTSDLTIGNIGAVAPGTYNMILTANSASGTKTVDLTLIISSTTPTATTLLTPANASIGNNNPVGFSWTAVSGSGISYIIQIASDAGFNNIVETNTLTTNSYLATSTLTGGATYYWRVTAITGCGSAPASTVFSFTMSTCTNFSSTNVPINISATGTPTVTSTLAISGLNGNITDVNVTNLVGTHTWINDLTVRLTSPASTVVTLFNRVCNNEDNFNVKFDDAATLTTLPCPPTSGLFYRPNQLLSGFNGQNGNGTWTLTIVDNADQDGGSLTGWSIQVCVATPSACAISSSASSQANVACFGGSTGSVTVAGSGGTAPYSYVWSNGRTTSSNTGLAAGTYTVTVSDAASCLTTQTITITQPAAALSTTQGATTNVSCFGQSNGSTSVTVSGGTSGYSYLWSNGRTTTNNTGLAAGTYTVTVTDANGCSSNRSITITQPSALSTTAGTTTNVACFGGTTGSTSVTVSGGTATYTYLWSNSRTTANITGLSAGTYTVTVTDANGCNTNRSITITQPSSALSSNLVSANNATCTTAGSIDITVSGGNSGYTYLWSNGATTQDLNGLSAGNYTVSITDAGGCTIVNGPISINSVGTPSASITSINNVSCNGSTNGSANISVSGGTPGYNFLWNNGASTQNINGLAAGNYSVTVTDAAGCVATIATVAVTQPAVLSSAPTSTGASCAGNDGTATAAVTGGTAPYTIAWSNGGNGNSISGLVPGNYSLTVTDANVCVTSASVNVANNCSACFINTSFVVNATLCNTSCNGYAEITPLSGTAPFTYSWNDSGSGAVRNDLCAAVYTVTITDNNGCNNIQTLTITEPSMLTASANSTATACVANSGTASATVGGGTAPYSYFWSNGNVNSTQSGLSSGNYTVTVTDANGCVQTAQTNISIPASASLSASASPASCYGLSNASISLNVSGGTAPYSFNWSNGANTQNVNNIPAGIYSVTVTDANSCAGTSTVTVSEPAALSSSATFINSSGTNDGSIDLSVTGGTAPYSFVWNNAATTEDLNGLAAGTYNVTVTDANGCQTTQSVTLIIVAIEGIETVEQFVVMPNPSNGEFTIQVDLAMLQNLKVELVDVLGRSLRVWNFSETDQLRIPVDISEQAGGMYLVILRTEDGKLMTRKVSVTK
jgi:subtilisin-like proprotein convertase family protein